MCKESEKKQETVSPLPGYIEDASKKLVDKASGLADKPFEAYTGDRTAEFTADQLAGFQQLRDLISGAPNVLPEALQGARDYAAAPAQAVSTERVVDENGQLGAISDYMNPYQSNVIDTAVRRIQEQADAQRKRIGAGATSSGAYGDARHGILEATLGRDTSTAVGDTAGSLAQQGFNTAMNQRSADLNRFLTADTTNANFAEQALDRGMTGSGALLDRAAADQATQLQQIQALLGAGGQQQALGQADLDAAYQEFMRGQNYDFDTLQALSAALSGVPYERRQTTTSTQPDNSLLGLAGSIAGAALGGPMGASLGGMLGGGGAGGGGGF